MPSRWPQLVERCGRGVESGGSARVLRPGCKAVVGRLHCTLPACQVGGPPLPSSLSSHDMGATINTVSMSSHERWTGINYEHSQVGEPPLPSSSSHIESRFNLTLSMSSHERWIVSILIFTSSSFHRFKIKRDPPSRLP